MTYQIEICQLNKFYGAFHALKDVDLKIKKGEFVALVGPSGCGKSTLLRSLAGLEPVQSGDIRIAGDSAVGMPPRKRDLGMVFQSYALYPHMTVRRNLTYSLRLKRAPKIEANQKADEVARITGLENLLDRYPAELSGGQRQRVAMGRAIMRNPKAFLFDEPLSNLDAALRVRMRAEIRALHDRINATTVYVTHDQIEAMTMADRVVVMNGGIIEQQGHPLELYDRPRNLFVARFIGSPAMNTLDGVISEDGRKVILETSEKPALEIADSHRPGLKVTVGMRPEHLQICRKRAKNSTFAITVDLLEETGSKSHISSFSDGPISVNVPERTNVKRGDRVSLEIAPELLHLFDMESGESLRH